jgi:hypothetical protein
MVPFLTSSDSAILHGKKPPFLNSFRIVVLVVKNKSIDNPPPLIWGLGPIRNAKVIRGAIKSLIFYFLLFNGN